MTRAITLRMLAIAICASIASFGAHAADQRTFASPQEGFEALAAAIKKDDLKALESILGPEGHALIYSGDKVADDNTRNAFTKAYAIQNSVSKLDDLNVALAIGADEWEFPIPIKKAGNSWRFDTAVGKEEVINRRIGRNETAAIKTAHAYVQAQREYAAKSGATYAQRVVSSAGAKDGLYWPTKSGEAESPLGPLFARAENVGYTIPKSGHQPAAPTPYYGYVYKILTAQGPAADGGKRSYVANGKMTGGFALVAYPATYGTSGVMTFIVNQDDKVFQKDLGPDTANVASKMTAFDPLTGWTVTN